ncbi:Ail/Lom family outer membrane beta-barrel protein [Salmonella enterica subsp. enterica serovar Oslo]|nr:Ail/Lom family outer membrane beta-barrel protein [Salmonella enterica subsp. enterica serovar Oslo]
MGPVGIVNAAAPENTLSVGYAYSHIKDFGNLNGVNLSYRYEFTPEWGVLGSFSYAEGKDSGGFNQPDTNEREHWGQRVNYYSLLVGPTYRINDYVSLYGQIGVAYIKSHGSYDYTSTWDSSSEHYSANKTGFAYGAGVQFNPVENVALTVGYEGASFGSSGDDTDSVNTNGFNIGVGYSF